MKNELTAKTECSEQSLRYKAFLSNVTIAGCLWGIWCGKAWATASDPSHARAALFLIWGTRSEAGYCLKNNPIKFPPDAKVDSIDLHKWIDFYTQDIIEANAATLFNADAELRGVIVGPEDLRRDLLSAGKGELVLQGKDLMQLKARALRKQRAKSQKN